MITVMHRWAAVGSSTLGRLLRGLRCSRAQGYLYARPLPASDARPAADEDAALLQTP